MVLEATIIKCCIDFVLIFLPRLEGSPRKRKEELFLLDFLVLAVASICVYFKVNRGRLLCVACLCSFRCRCPIGDL